MSERHRRSSSGQASTEFVVCGSLFILILAATLALGREGLSQLEAASASRDELLNRVPVPASALAPMEGCRGEQDGSAAIGVCERQLLELLRDSTR